ncbi:aminotransferase class I/II-fold pyridoxal phosphate-dependent enzyme [uncultured Intestinimonas sp.]|uniref:pyridoxal phosphate-dependent aminotransferase n=1 Tax=uncultured Intestinimonas sp. TaxID=1689265 RepID=UPI003444A014
MTALKESTHGGDLVSARVLWAGEVLDFSANLNPLGMPEGVRRAAAEGVEEAVHYPDPLCRALSAAIARRDGVAPGQVLCGNGAADLVFRLAFSEGPRRALVTAPTFSEYEAAVSAAGCTVVRHILDRARNFDLTGAVLDELTPELDLAFFCTPNNPTGRVIDRGLLEAILEKSRAAGVRLVVDECFLALSDGGEAAGLAGYLEPYPNLLLLRAFTKSYAMPGLRLGYCLSADGALLDRISRCAQPWSVSAPAQAAGLAAAAEPSHPRLARALIARERSRLMRALEGLGLEVIPSAANYLLFRAPGITDLRERLLRRGVLIRSCADYPGLGEDDYRIAVRLQEENEQLIRAMKEAL